MEEKRKEPVNQPPASSIAADGTPSKTPESPAPAEPPSSRRRGGQKRKASGGNASTPSTTSSKRQAREKPSAASQPPIHNGPCTRARQSPAAASVPPVSVVAPSNPAVKNETDAASVTPPNPVEGEVAKAVEETAVVEEDLEALEAKIEAEYELIRSRDSNVHVVPIPAGWFSWTRIHPLEKRTLPSFFNDRSENRTPEIYTEIRNWIMRKFHADPNTQIELKDLSEFSVGELDARQELMEFLDHWGLINYHPFSDSDNAVVNADDRVAKKDTLVEKLYLFDKAESSAPVVVRDNVTTPAAPSRLFPESAIAEELAGQEGPAVDYHCNSCSADCSRKRYHCQKQADFDLCSECFNNGMFDCDMSPADFILMEPADAAGLSGGKWTDQETLLLLEALELYKENWNEIADHVATKTKAQCILHFVQMPIEENVMDCDDEIEASNVEDTGLSRNDNDTSAPKDSSETTGSKTETDADQLKSSLVKISVPEDANEKEVVHEKYQNFALKALHEAFEAVGSSPTPGGQFSFSEAGNPVMALAAFLVRLAEPNIATAMVHNSLKCISGNPSSMQLAARHCFVLEDPPHDKKNSADTDSAIAGVVEPDTKENDEQNKGNHKEETSNAGLEGGDLPNDHNSEKIKDCVSKEKEACSSPTNNSPGKLTTANDSSSNESDKPDSHKDQEATDAKESDELIPKTEIHPISAKVSVDKDENAVESRDKKLVSPKEVDNPDFQTDRDAVAEYASNGSDPKEDISLGSAEEQGNRATEEEPYQHTESPKEAVAIPGSLSSAKKDGDEESKDIKNENHDHSTISADKLKRAAVTAISAAAVKAKLLADQEEDQIRQLATLLIEKQLHKLETKLAFFSDMESSVMRVREQMERTKQRLYQERAQIIATRFGMPPSSSRPMQQSLTINRVAMGFANSATRPPMGMSSQRPPMSRPMMAMAPPSTFVPTTTMGNPVRPINQDKVSFVTK